MLRDQCITVDGDDCITGSCSKLEAHQFNERQPRGRLHRAFSVFLFNSDNRLLLQQRAASKVGAPAVAPAMGADPWLAARPCAQSLSCLSIRLQPLCLTLFDRRIAFGQAKWTLSNT